MNMKYSKFSVKKKGKYLQLNKACGNILFGNFSVQTEKLPIILQTHTKQQVTK